MTEGDDGLGCWLEYNTDLFAEDSVRRLLDHFEILLAGIVADPNERISHLPLVHDRERQLLTEWNQTEVAFPTRHSLQEMFESQVAKTPNATALVCGDEQLTYAELNSRANQLGRYLRSLGVAARARVAICLNRSTEMVVALWPL